MAQGLDGKRDGLFMVLGYNPDIAEYIWAITIIKSWYNYVYNQEI